MLLTAKQKCTPQRRCRLHKPQHQHTNTPLNECYASTLDRPDSALAQRYPRTQLTWPSCGASSHMTLASAARTCSQAPDTLRPRSIPLVSATMLSVLKHTTQSSPEAQLTCPSCGASSQMTLASAARTCSHPSTTSCLRHGRMPSSTPPAPMSAPTLATLNAAAVRTCGASASNSSSSRSAAAPAATVATAVGDGQAISGVWRARLLL
jgi:hypothetical protein